MLGALLKPSSPSDPTPDSDTGLIDRFRSGDETAFEEVVRRYQERIFQFVHRVVRDTEEAADITQETFIRAYGKLGGFRGDSSLFTWLYRIALNMSINCLRKRKLRSFVPLWDSTESEFRPDEFRPDEFWAQGGPEEDMAASRLRTRVEEAISGLPPRQRSIFVLRQYDQLSHREIAEVVGSSEGAVRAGYFHALRKLRCALQDCL
jgi:RNA polymerase sigma-70 factor (ECF subfamily)